MSYATPTDEQDGRDPGAYLVQTRDEEGNWAGFVQAEQAFAGPGQRCLRWTDPHTGQKRKAYHYWDDVAWMLLQDLNGAMNMLIGDGADESSLFLTLYPSQTGEGLAPAQLVGEQVDQDERMPDMVVRMGSGDRHTIVTASWLQTLAQGLGEQNIWATGRTSGDPVLLSRATEGGTK